MLNASDISDEAADAYYGVVFSGKRKLTEKDALAAVFNLLGETKYAPSDIPEEVVSAYYTGTFEADMENKDKAGLASAFNIMEEINSNTAKEAHKRNSEENPAHIFLNSEIERFEEGNVPMQSLCGVPKFTRGFGVDDLDAVHRCPKCIEIAEGKAV